MILQSAIAAELPFLRAEAEARMVSTAAVMRKTSLTAQNETTGLEAAVWATVYPDAPFRLGGSERGGSTSRTVTLAEGELQIAVRVGHFPADHDLLADGDLIEITSGENEGLVLRVIEAEWQDQATARRVPVVTEQRPSEWA